MAEILTLQQASRRCREYRDEHGEQGPYARFGEMGDCVWQGALSNGAPIMHHCGHTGADGVLVCCMCGMRNEPLLMAMRKAAAHDGD